MNPGPTSDCGGLTSAFLRILPEPVKRLYRAALPEALRAAVRGRLAHERNLVRAVHFWANPWERHRRREELRRCEAPGDYFAFATKYLGHQQWQQEILGFLEFAREARPVRICELGLFLGGTNVMLTHALPTVELVIGVDLHVRNRSQLRYLGRATHRQVYIEGPTCAADTLRRVTQTLGGEELDLLFIDADHTYAGVRQDFLHYRHFVREGGVIAFHDIVPDHMTRFGHDPATWEGARSGEVYRFWRKVKPAYENTREFVADYDQDGCGIGALLYSSQATIPADL